MKRLKRWMAISAGAIGLLLVLFAVLGLYRGLEGAPTRDLSDLTISRSNWLVPQKKLSFSLEAGRTKLRLLTNAALPPGSLENADKQFYSFNYRVLDAAGATLRTGEYYLRLHTTQYAGRPRRSFETQDATPSDTNLFYLDFTDVEQPHTLELWMGSGSQPLSGTAVRSYYQELRPAERLERIWERLHDDKRARLAEANALGVEFLTPEESRNLVRANWKPLVPRGIEGADYEIAMLIDEPSDESLVEQTNLADRWFLPAGRRATLGLNEAARLLISASRPSGRMQPDDLRVRWSGRLRHERTDLDLAMTGPGLGGVASLERGIVVFEASADLWLTTADAQRSQPLLPEPNIVRVYDASAAGVTIPVHHVRNLPTPVRLDLRLEPGIATAQLQIELVGPDGVVRTERVDLVSGDSTLDWIVQRGVRREIGNRRSLYLSAPANVNRIRLTSRETVWVSAYNRPPTLTQTVQIPESLFGGTIESRRFPRWFVLAPENSDALIGSPTSAIVESQLEPPEDRPLQDALSHSERLFPEQNRPGITILSSNDPRREVSAAARGYYFQKLKPGSQSVDLAATPGIDKVAPTLLIESLNSSGSLIIDVDGRRVTELDVTPSSGQIILPDLPVGTRHWVVQAPQGMDLYVSDTELTGQTYRRQNLQALTAEPFTYRLQRHSADREVLAFRIFARSPGRVRLLVKLDSWNRAVEPQKSWTLQATEYDLALEQTNRAISLGGEQRELNYEAMAFFTIGSDVPAASMSLEVSALDNPVHTDGYQDNGIYLGITRSGVELTEDSPVRIQRFEVTNR